MERLPIDILKQIFSFLDGEQLLKCKLVCKFWKNTLLDDKIWKSVFFVDKVALMSYTFNMLVEEKLQTKIEKQNEENKTSKVGNKEENNLNNTKEENNNQKQKKSYYELFQENKFCWKRNVEHLKNCGRYLAPLHFKQIIKQIQPILFEEPNVLQLLSPITIVGNLNKFSFLIFTHKNK